MIYVTSSNIEPDFLARQLMDAFDRHAAAVRAQVKSPAEMLLHDNAVVFMRDKLMPAIIRDGSTFMARALDFQWQAHDPFTAYCVLHPGMATGETHV